MRPRFKVPLGAENFAPRNLKEPCSLVPKIHGSNNYVWLIFRREADANPWSAGAGPRVHCPEQ